MGRSGSCRKTPTRPRCGTFPPWPGESPRMCRDAGGNRPGLTLRHGVRLLVLVLAGCGSNTDSSGLKLVALTGTVLRSDGKPLTHARIEFHPDGETRGQGGKGLSDPEGKYTLTTPRGG